MGSNYKGTPLIFAATRGDLKAVQLLVEDCNVNVDQRATVENIGDSDILTKQATALMCAAYQGHLDIVKFLVNRGCDVNLVNDRGENALFLACAGSQLEVVKYLVDIGAHIESADEAGYTCLMVACDRGSEELVQYLLERGADPNRKAKYSEETALHFAVMAIACGVVETLLRYGAAMSKNKSGFSPLLLAASNRFKDVVDVFLKIPFVERREKIDALEVVGARMAAYNMDGAYGCLQLAMEERYRDPSEIIPKSHSPLPVLQHLAESRTQEELEARQTDQDALRLECLAIVQRVIGLESWASHSDFTNYARQLTRAGRWDDALAVLLHGCKKDGEWGRANSAFQLNVAQILATFGDMLLNGQSLLFSTVSDVLELVLDTFQQFEALSPQAVPGSEQLMKDCLHFITIGLKVSHSQSDKRLLQRQVGRLIRLRPALPDGRSVLHEAVTSYWNRPPCLEQVDNLPYNLLVPFLLHCGADVNAMDDTNNKPLHIIARLTPAEDTSALASSIMRTLLEAGALVGVKNSEGKTPLDVAGTKTTIILLREHYPASLKSLAATAVVKNGIPYKGEIPRELEELVPYH